MYMFVLLRLVYLLKMTKHMHLLRVNNGHAMKWKNDIQIFSSMTRSVVGGHLKILCILISVRS